MTLENWSTNFLYSEFSCGEGEIQLFCLEGVSLEDALTRYQARPQYRLTSSPLPPLPIPHALLASRRLSRSEGDLQCWPADSSFSLFHLRTQSMSRNSSHDKVIYLCGFCSHGKKIELCVQFSFELIILQLNP